MIVVNDIDQGTDDWLSLRLGVATASCADRIQTATGSLSQQWKPYAAELAGELYVGAQDEFFVSKWMERGTELEPKARDLFSMIMDIEVDTPGFVYMDESRTIGCSPDGLFGIGLEIKCPKLSTHMLYLSSGKVPAKYYPQVQFSMMVTGCENWWFMSYHPKVKPLIVPVRRDEKFIGTLLERTLNVVTERDKILKDCKGE